MSKICELRSTPLSRRISLLSCLTTLPLSEPELVLEPKDQAKTLLLELPPVPPAFHNTNILPTSSTVALRLRALGDEVDRALWLDQVLATHHSLRDLHPQAGTLLQAKAFHLDLVVQVHGATHRFLPDPVVPRALKLLKVSGLHLSSPPPKSQSLLLDPVQTSQRELPKQNPNLTLKRRDSPPTRLLLQSSPSRRWKR